MKIIYALCVAVLLVCAAPTPSAAQVQPPAVPRANVTASAAMRVAWTQQTITLAEAQALGYFMVVDGAPAPMAAPVVCEGAVAPFLCSTVFPSLTPGDHGLQVIASFALAGGGRVDSLPSAPALLVRMVITPLAPSELRILFK